jgi:hypothetical protein
MPKMSLLPPEETESLYEGSNLRLSEIGPAIVKAVNLEPDAVDRVIAKPNHQGLFLGIEAGDQKVGCQVYNIDNAPEKDPEQVLNDLLHRSDLTSEQRGTLTSALQSFNNPDALRSKIRCITDVPLLSEFDAAPIEYLLKPIVVRQSVVALTGPSGDGKSSLASKVAGRVAEQGVPVLLLDKDNPRPVVKDRFQRLGVTDGLLFRVWGGWCPEEPCQLDSEIVATWVKSCEPKPLIILDSFGAFFDGDENQAGQVRAFFRPIRQLVNLGATVLVLHNDGKSETSEYRGSAAFKDCVDAAFHVSNSPKNGPLNWLTVKCYKSRYGFTGELVYRYADGRMELASTADGPTDVSADASADKLAQLLAQNPGIKTRAFTAAAKATGVSDRKARRYLVEGVAAGHIKKVGTRSKGYSHYLVEGVS